MESLPWPTITVAGGGWTLFGLLAWLVMRKLVSGDLLTRREGDAKDDEIKALRQSNHELLEQNGLMLREALPTTNAVLTALREAAEEAPR